MICALWHSWGEWRMYEERGLFILGRLTGAPGREVNYSETRQIRKCGKCGKVQDEHVKDGPMAPAEK
jgi:hypothetical protein